MCEAKTSFLGEAMRTIAELKQVSQETGCNTEALSKEIFRQIEEAEDPITGKGVTKSGEED